MQKFPLPPPLIFSPQLQRPRREFCIRLAGTVSCAHDARFAARRSPRIARTPRIQQSDACAALKQVQRSPSAKGPGANYRNVKFGFHFESVDAEMFGCPVSPASSKKCKAISRQSRQENPRRSRGDAESLNVLRGLSQRSLRLKSFSPALQLSSKTYPFASKMMDG